MKDCAKDLSHDSSKNCGKKPAEKSQAQQANAATEERNCGGNSYEEKQNKQDLRRRLPQLDPND